MKPNLSHAISTTTIEEYMQTLVVTQWQFRQSTFIIQFPLGSLEVNMTSSHVSTWAVKTFLQALGGHCPPNCICSICQVKVQGVQSFLATKLQWNVIKTSGVPFPMVSIWLVYVDPYLC